MAGSNLPTLSQYASSPVRYAELAVFPSFFIKPSHILIALTHGGMARLSGMDKYGDGRPAKGCHQSQH